MLHKEKGCLTLIKEVIQLHRKGTEDAGLNRILFGQDRAVGVTKHPVHHLERLCIWRCLVESGKINCLQIVCDLRSENAASSLSDISL